MPVLISVFSIRIFGRSLLIMVDKTLTVGAVFTVITHLSTINCAPFFTAFNSYRSNLCLHIFFVFKNITVVYSFGIKEIWRVESFYELSFNEYEYM